MTVHCFIAYFRHAHTLLLHLLRQKFYGLLPKDSKLNYGRVFTQRWIVKEIVALTIASMVDAGEDFDSDEYDDFASRSLPEWTKEDWEAFKNSIVNLKANVLQRGATASLDEEDNNAPDTARCRNNIYSIDKILRIVDVNVIFSPLRGALMEQLKDENKEGVAEVDKELLSSFLYVFLHLVAWLPLSSLWMLTPQ